MVVMKKRVISAAILIALAVTCVFLSRLSRVLFFAVCGMLCAYELSKNFEKLDARCTLWVMVAYLLSASAVAVFYSLYIIDLSQTISLTLVLFIAAVYTALFSGIIHEKVSGKGALYTVAGICYPCVLFVALMLISVSDIWISALCVGCISSWMCDAFALFGGKRFGKHKVAPRISPAKTVEGCISGALSSIVAGIFIYFVIFPLYDAPYSLFYTLAAALISSTMGQIGDLAESMLKRLIGVKDFSNLIPGHGGMFDRADSLLFSIPTAFFLLRLYELI